MRNWDVHFDVDIAVGNQIILELVARCRALASVINKIPITPNRQVKIDRLNILRAVRGTTGIEGAQLTEEEVGQIMDAMPGKSVLPMSRRREEQEARNAKEVMTYVAGVLKNDPQTVLTEELVCKLHEITTKDIDYEHCTPGKYRSHAVSAGDYIPPLDYNTIRELMTRFVFWLLQEKPANWDPIIKAIVAHFYIVSIHPFGDGNGRTSRAVESFMLYRAGINARGFYSLANYYYKNRAEYVAHLNKVRFETNGDLTPFVLFALCGLAEELESVHQEVMFEVREISFRDYVRDTLYGRLGTKSGERMLQLVLGLGYETVSLKDLRSGKHKLSYLYANLTPKTISRDINYLESSELITKNDGAIRANIEIMDKFTPPFELVR